ncbi:DUF1254 domain-containing protein [Stappia stellulata]|uniref:DUF1254 domain-containing protein n=1 Tax=Stappia stellulata TaxID=71235 RepID=UPI0004095162|nr:DUF1254 domain-containing protein [Stappia stellulata]
MTRLTTLSALALTLAMGPAFAEVSPAELEAISIPDTVETAIGTLEFFDGVPTDATIATVYDNYDRMRGLQVFLDNIGAVSMYSVRTGLADAGAEGANRIALFADLMDSETLVVTANTSTLYAYTYTDLAKDGPTVIDVPPGMLGFLNDGWQRFVGNMGVTGPDAGKGGKYLIVPPGYAGDIPDGYFLLKPPTNRNFMFLRGSIANGLAPAVENITSNLKVYPLKDAADPAATEFVNVSNMAFNTVFPSDASYFTILDQIIQEEPLDAIGPEARGAIAAIGIVKGETFAPDDRMQARLAEAATLANATARAITYHPRIAGVRIYPDNPKSVWSTAFANRDTSFQADGTMNLDARAIYYFNAGGVTPAMATSSPGQGSDYALAFLDGNGQAFDGSKTYKLTLPKDVPVKDFWAVTLYDTQTRSQLQTGQSFPTIGSQTDGMTANADGSYDIFFAPTAPEGKEGNWLQTVPGKSWFTILRMYGPLEPWIDQSWRPGQIELVQ